MNLDADRANGLLAIDDSSAIGAARRTASALAQQAGLSEAAVGRVAIVATELATNLWRHARSGRLLWRVLAPPNAAGVELLAVDAGPGMADIERCLRDGYSSVGTAGEGLGAVRRLADVFDIVSTPDVGSVLLARVVERGATPMPPAPFRFGVVALPIQGEEVCGDGWDIHVSDGTATVLLVDGLGHGPEAAAASAAARDCFRRQPDRPPAASLAAMHVAMQGSRGGAVAVAQVRPRDGRVSYAGVGNIAGTLVAAGRTRGLASQHGILGTTVGRLQEFDHAWDRDTMLVMHSDGLLSRWSLDPAEETRDPALIAGRLYQRFTRGRDDITVAVLQARAA